MSKRTAHNLDDLYQAAHALKQEEKRALIERLLKDLEEKKEEKKEASILDFYGLGKEIWEGVDVEEYVSNLRDEWERNPLV